MSTIVDERALSAKQLLALDRQLRQKRLNAFTKRPESIRFDTSSPEGLRLPIAVAQAHNLLEPCPTVALDWAQAGGLRGYQADFLRDHYSSIRLPAAHGWEILPGLGKTVMAVELLKRIHERHSGWRADIYVPRRCLLEQWKSHLGDLSWATVRMAAELSSCTAQLVVVDEAHLIVTKSSLCALTAIRPQFLLGLSGTFWRTDILDVFLGWLFATPLRLGSQPSRRQLTVHLTRTEFSPQLVQTSRGTLDWNVVLKSLSSNTARNALILDVLLSNDRQPGMRTLILTKYLFHNELLVAGAASRGIELAAFDESRPMPKNLVATFKKCGTGLSLDGFGAVILAVDVMDYTLQYVSRVIRSAECVGHIWDFVDKHPSLQRHYKVRAKVYRELGASWA